MTARESVDHLADAVLMLLSRCSDGRLDDALTLCRIAESLGCKVSLAAYAEPSYAPAPGLGTPSGRILLDAFADAVELLRRLAHELTHHILYWWDTYFISCEDAVLAIGTLEHAEEIVCNKVADMIAALPQGFQWNGKIAVPRGTVIRRFKRRPIPDCLSLTPEEADRLIASSR